MARGLALLCIILFCGSVLARHHRVIIDPAKNNDDLKFCNHSSECEDDRYCAEDEEYDDQLVCLHKELLDFISLRDVLGSLCLFLGTMVAAAAGIGGGGLNVPIMMLIFNFLIEEAIPFSHCAVFGNSLAQFIVNVRRRHPHAVAGNRLLIDVAVASLLLPAQLGGNSFGVVISAVMPGFLLIVLSIVLMTFVTVRMAQKFRSIFREESHKHNALLEPASYSNLNDEGHTEQVSFFAVLPVKELAGMLIFWALFSTDYLLVGGHSGWSVIPNLEYCSYQYWLLYCAVYPIILITIAIAIYHLTSEYQKQVKALMPVDPTMQWTVRRACLTVLAALIVGLVAGLLGLGGGEFMGPLLLELGLQAESASGTSAFLILFTTSSNVVHYLFLGEFPVEYSLWFVILGFCGGLIGRFLALKLVNKSGRRSYLVGALAFVLFLSTSLLVYRGTASLVEQVTHHEVVFDFHPLCK